MARNFLLLFLVVTGFQQEALSQGIKKQVPRKALSDSIQANMKRLADSIRDMNGGTVPMPPSEAKRDTPATTVTPQTTPKKERRGRTGWMLGGVILFLLTGLWFWRRKKSG